MDRIRFFAGAFRCAGMGCGIPGDNQCQSLYRDPTEVIQATEETPAVDP